MIAFASTVRQTAGIYSRHLCWRKDVEVSSAICRFVGDVLRCCDPMVLRIALMSHHYRSGFEWHNSMLERSKRLLCGTAVGHSWGGRADPRLYIAEVRAALDDELDVTRGVRAVADLAGSITQGGGDPTAVEGLLTCWRIVWIDFSSVNGCASPR
jgi:L-cysteine:1D-myo-inositol 2-amino-2-deoxy-alpha-D-glucopyranoside ligase